MRHRNRPGAPSRGSQLPPPEGYRFDEDNPTRPVRPSPLSRSQVKDLPLGLLDRVRALPLFQSTPDEFVEEVIKHLRPQAYSKNDYILTEGEEAKAMYWLVRGEVAVTSRDGESIYAELKPGAFFGEIGILMDRPRTATIIARYDKCQVVVLKKEDLQKILPSFPEVEKAIMNEAQMRLTILEKKKKQSAVSSSPPSDSLVPARRSSKRSIEGVVEALDGTVNGVNKKRKSPSPGLPTISPSSALEAGVINVGMLLKELPLFSTAPDDVLKFLGMSAIPKSFPPFTDIIKQDSPGREVYFICRGEVEVLDEHPDGLQRRQSENYVNGIKREPTLQPPLVKARLKQGHYFGEIVSLSLTSRRTATVRTISEVECLMITGQVLEEFWERLPRDIRQQIERTAKERLATASDGDVVMPDAGDSATPAIDELELEEKSTTTPKKGTPRVTFNESDFESPHKPIRIEDRPNLKPSDPDPFLSTGLNNVRSRSRRGSLAPIPPDESPSDNSRRTPSPPESRASVSSPLKPKRTSQESDNPFSFLKKPQRPHRPPSNAFSEGRLPESVLVNIFQYLDLLELMRLRQVSLRWSQILTKHPDLIHVLDLAHYNRKVTDDALTNVICPFVGSRPRVIDISNCFHITDEGFTSLAVICGANVISWKMKSVWDVTAPAILEMANKARGLQEVDLSNCRKVSDTLLARIVGWVVQQTMGGPPQQQSNGRPVLNTRAAIQGQQQIPAGTVFGCPQLKRLTLSYCKHVTDRSMHHIASHAAPRLEQVDLTRCTTITDQGFQYWGNAQFSRLRKLCLADCTYLTDNAIVYLTNAAKQLQELDLSFCCALSDTATEVLALGCPHLTHLNLSFCGSAVSDPSLRSIGLHLLSLRELSVRGCVRVTGVGVEAVLEGCRRLEVLDVSQCKNLRPWLEGAGSGGGRGGNSAREWLRTGKVRWATINRDGKLTR